MSYAIKLKPHELNLWRTKKPVLGLIDIELTERCNNNCMHCCINQPEDDTDILNREMSTEFVKKILIDAASLGCLTVRFTGGEPLLRSDFAELYFFTRRIGMQVMLLTNARLITSDIVQLLVKFPPGHTVEVSVYGMKPESYNLVAGHQDAFDEFKQGIDLLLQYQVPFIVKSPKLHVLKGEQDAFEAWAATIPSMLSKPGYSMNFDLRSRRDNPDKNAHIEKIRATPDETVAQLVRNPSYLKDMVQFCSRFMGVSGDKLFNCGAGLETCIDAYGHAQLCLSLRKKDTVVDLHEVSLKKALEEIFPTMRELKATNPDYLRRCAQCFLSGLCDQCPAKSWMEYGTLDTPVEYQCDVAHAKARHFGLIKENEKAWEVENWKERLKHFEAIHG